MASPVTTYVARLLRERVAALPADPSHEEVNQAFRLLGRWRSQLLANTYIARHGAKIAGGPFAGMDYVESATEGALIPRLLGTYESELHPHLRRIIDGGLDSIIDVGCAEGYYAVGLARMAPSVTVHAYDTDENARRMCAELAAKNGVSDRVLIGGEFAPDGFQAFAGQRVLVMVDTEGAEVDILQPDKSPALSGMHIIVETHDVYRRGALATMVQRFSPTHDIVQVDLGPKTFDMPDWLRTAPHLDQLIAIWEWRAAPTPWLVMSPKAAP